MVRRLIAFFSESISGIHAAAYVIATFALVSQILGLVRDRMLAHIFGAGPTLDVYYAAFRIPNFCFASIASIVSLFVLIPLLSDRLEKQGKLEAKAASFTGHHILLRVHLCSKRTPLVSCSDARAFSLSRI